MWEKYDSVEAAWLAVGDVALVDGKVIHITRLHHSFDLVHIDGYDDEWEEEFFIAIGSNESIPLLIPA